MDTKTATPAPAPEVNPLSLPFSAINVSGSGKLGGKELDDFVAALMRAAFLPGDADKHDGWAEYQKADILKRFAAEGTDFLTQEQYDKMIELRPLTLFTKPKKTIAVIGAGAFGIAMAVALSSGGHDLRLLVTSSRTDAQLKARDELTMSELAEYINTKRTYPTLTKKQRKIAGQLRVGQTFPPNMTAVADPEKALAGADYIVDAIPTQHTYGMLLKLAKVIPAAVPIVSVSKGICSTKYVHPDGKRISNTDGDKLVAEGKGAHLEPHPTYMKTMDQVIDMALQGANPVVALAGPSFAKFLCMQEQTAVTVACADEALAREVAEVFSTPIFKCYYTTDIVGAEVSGALKNIVAIACGMCIGCPKFNLPADLPDACADAGIPVKELTRQAFKAKKGGSGLGLGPNASALLITRAWEDVRTICTKLGARSETMLSLSGLGDLILTCYGGESRNCKFGGILGMGAKSGLAIGEGSEDFPTFEFVLDHPEIYPVCEGYYTSLALTDMANQLKLDLPVLSKLCGVLQRKILPQDLISLIMTEPISPEFNRDVKDLRIVKPAGPLHLAPVPPLKRREKLLRRKLQLDTGKLQEQDQTSSPRRITQSAKSIALLMIEYQNEFAAAKGKLHGAVAETMKQTNMLENSMALVKEARAAGCTVIHAPIMFLEDDSDNPNPQPRTILHNCADGKLFKAGTWNAQYVEGMAPGPTDLEVDNKRGLCSFSNTNLDALLQAQGVETIVFCGFLTSCCVESSMRTGYERGYNCITITDCTADTSVAGWKAATDGTFKLFSNPMTKDEFVGNILAKCRDAPKRFRD